MGGEIDQRRHISPLEPMLWEVTLEGDALIEGPLHILAQDTVNRRLP